MLTAHKHRSGRWVILSIDKDGRIYPWMSKWWKEANTEGMGWTAGDRVSTVDARSVAWFLSYASKRNAMRRIARAMLMDVESGVMLVKGGA